MRKLATAAAVSLALASGGAFGLGLGEIEMQSALNQPMNAEIRLISVKPGELDGMIVKLASPEAFSRAGIDRSSALTGLRFRVDQSSGTPVIKIESEQPVVEPFLNFLLEVDWPQGRMVREYTVLLDPPVFMSPSASERNIAADQPAVVQSGDAALVVPTPIERDTLAADAGLDAELPELQDANTEEILSLDEATAPGQLVPDSSLLISDGSGLVDGLGEQVALTDSGVANTAADAQREIDAAQSFSLDDIQVEIGGGTEEVSDEVVLGEDGQLRIDSIDDDEGTIVSLDDIEEPAQDSTESVTETITQATSSAGEEVTVNSGDTLFEIASDAAPSGVSVQQMMLAILAANESSFINNNINLVREGAILRIPETSEATRLTQAQALAQISDQNQLWQDYRDSLRNTASTQVAQTTEPTPEQPAAEESEAAEIAATDATSATDTSGAAGNEPLDTASLESDTAIDGLSAEARAILESARQEILDGEELRIVADNSPANTTASATADETSETSEDAQLGAVNRRLQLAREELAASRLRTSDLSEQSTQLDNTTANLEAMVTLRQNEIARLEGQLASAREAAEVEAQAAVDTVADAASDATEAASDAASEAADAVSTVADGAADAVVDTTDAATAVVTDATSQVTDAASDALAGAGQAEDAATDAAEDSLADAGETLQSTDLAPIEPSVERPAATVAGNEAQTWFQSFMDDPKRMAIAGIGGLGLLGVLGTLLFRRKRKHPDVEDAAAPAPAPENINDAPTVQVTQEVEKPNLFDGTSSFDKAGVAGVAGVAAATGYVGAKTGPEHTDSLDYLDKTFAGDDMDGTSSPLDFEAASADAMFGSDDEQSASLDADDTISEVDVYLAYGLHGQAEELLTKAIERNPGNAEYAGKLLMTYHAQGNSEAFRATAADYHARFGGDENPEWAAISAMGAELDPHQALYAAAKDTGAGVGSGQSERAALAEDDFMSTGEHVSVNREFDASEPSSDFTEDETALMDASLDPAFAFDESDLEATGDFSAITGELAAEDSVTNDDGGVNFAGSAANENLQATQASDAVNSLMSANELDGMGESVDDLTLDLDQLSGDLEIDSAELLNTDLADLDLPDLTADNELLLDSTGQFGTGADEMDTMLDLAKAYIDMGDKDSASSALGEIVKSGSPEQINEAESLLRNIS